jgi:hypothetical protein
MAEQPVYQQPPPAQPVPQKKRRGCLYAALAVIAIAVLGFAGCMAVVLGGAKSVDDASKKEHKVVYEVTGTGKALNITYSTDGGSGTAQESSAKLPWKKELTVTGLIPIYQVSAQNDIGAAGDITCRITVDGKELQKVTSKGEGAIASCSGTNT